MPKCSPLQAEGDGSSPNARDRWRNCRRFCQERLTALLSSFKDRMFWFWYKERTTSDTSADEIANRLISLASKLHIGGHVRQLLLWQIMPLATQIPVTDCDCSYRFGLQALQQRRIQNTFFLCMATQCATAMSVISCMRNHNVNTMMSACVNTTCPFLLLIKIRRYTKYHNVYIKTPYVPSYF